MRDDPTEAELWERARHNDGDAFGALFDLHRERVHRRARGLVDAPHDAEDLTATAFFELWRKRRTVRTVEGSVLPWLLVTTVNLSRNLRRSTTRYQRFLREAPREVTRPGPDAEPVETRRRLAAALAQLTPADSALLVLTALEGVPITVAAETLGLKPATARVRLHRARARLRVDLRDLAPTALSPEGIGE